MLKQNTTQDYPPMSCCRLCLALLPLDYLHLFKMGHVVFFQQFLMVLIKLRLNLGCQNLGYQFGIDYSTVSRYFCKWLDVLYNRLLVFVGWPERDQLLKTMPLESGKNFRKCMIIIDCFEIFIERPTSLTARAQTWSNYKTQYH